MAKMNVSQSIQRTKRLTRQALSTLYQPTIGAITRRLTGKRETQLSELIANYDVIVMKHCFPSSDILEDIGKADPASPRQSHENYKAVYRLLRDTFDKNPNTLFIIWTLPPRHRLFKPSEGSKEANAARATEFSNWLKGDFLKEGGIHPNVNIWDFRSLVVDPDTNFLKYEYESDHDIAESHPNKLANNKAGPALAQFIVDSTSNFYSGGMAGQEVRIVVLHHSTGLNVYQYPVQGIPAWLKKYNATGKIVHSISHKWYPQAGNMPVHYYHSWLEGR
jgi:hypothetical protein